jgi:hypothetical protein
VHAIWQAHHIRPTVFLGLQTDKDPFTYGERAFCMASEIVKEEKGDRPTNLSELARMMGGKK